MDRTKQEKLPIDAKLLFEAVIELNISRRSVELYQPEHPLLKDSVQRAFEVLIKVFEQVGLLQKGAERTSTLCLSII